MQWSVCRVFHPWLVPGGVVNEVFYFNYLRGKGPDLAVEKFLRKTQDLDSYGAKFNIVQVNEPD